MIELRHGESPVCGSEHECLVRHAGEAVKPGGHELLQPRRNRQRLRRISNRTVRTQRACDLERVERVAARRLVQPEQRRPRHRAIESAAKQLLDGADAQRSDLDAFDPVWLEGVLDDGGLLHFTEPACPDQQQVRLGQPAKREPEGARRRGVEPLQIVDRDDKSVFREELQGSANRNSESTRIDGTARCILDEQRDLERPTPRRREGRQDVSESSFEEIAQAGVGESTLRLGRPRGEHPQPPLARVGDDGAPERRLSDAASPSSAIAIGPCTAGRRSRAACSELRSSSLPTTSTAISRTIVTGSFALFYGRVLRACSSLATP